MPNQYTSLPMPARFWAKVDTDGPAPAHRPELGPCWLWMPRPVGNGYGQFLFEGRSRPAHVVAWILRHGPIARGVFICHHCDVRRCVRPSHLFVGDHETNMADMVAKGRAPRGNPQPARGARHRSRTSPETLVRGGRHPNARLTEDVVREARRRYAAGGVSVERLAHWAGVSKSTMAKVIRGDAWQHVPASPDPSRPRANYIAAHRARQQANPTGLERALMSGLDAAGIAYEFQYVVGERFLCDFGFPSARLIVEVDGAYWHHTERHRQRDASKDAYLRACGFEVLRLTDVEITQHLDRSLARIQALLGQ